MKYKIFDLIVLGFFYDFTMENLPAGRYWGF